MSRYFFDIHDGQNFTSYDDGLHCATLKDLSYHAVDVLPDIVREELPDGPRRTFSVRVRDEAGGYVFRATLTLASAWIVEPSAVSSSPEVIDGSLPFLGQNPSPRPTPRVCGRRLSQHLEGLDSSFSVADAEVDRLVTRGPS